MSCEIDQAIYYRARRMFKMNQKGMGMVEVMVAAAMAAMVSLGVATMMQNSMKESRRVQLLDTLKNKKILFDNMMRDPDVWNATLNNNAGVPFTTLKTTNLSTSEIPFTNPVEFMLYNSDGSLAYNLLGPSESTGNGFTEKGGICTTFNAGAGSGTDNCPFSYRLLVGVECVTGTACTNPNLKLVARLVFNPSPTGVLASFTNFLSPVSGFSIADTVVDTRYDSVIKRTSTSINRSFRLISGFIPVAGCNTSLSQGGGGQCTTTSQVHVRTQQSTINTGRWDDSTAARGAYDTYNLVTINTDGSGSFKFNEAGYYGCMISVPAFGTQAFTASLRNTTAGTTVGEASITAPRYSSGVATIDAKFNVTNTTDNYAIYQNCQDDGSDGITDDYSYCTLGIPSTTYGAFQALITATCYKLDKSM